MLAVARRDPTVRSPPKVNENIFLLVPNLIGYARIALALVSLHFMPLHPRRCTFLYSASCLLDALDGYAARKFDQSSQFGAVLDMVTDRCTTACLLVFLAMAMPGYALMWQGLISLDFASHYMHMYATLATSGKGGGSHKNVSAGRSRTLNFYYKKWVLFTVCFMNEAFFVALYLTCFSAPADGSLGVGAAERFSAAAMERARAGKIDDEWPWVVVRVMAPGMMFKQFVNVLQLVKASQWLAEGDRRERRKAKLNWTTAHRDQV
ncbi:CDP-diacylglycerol--inositol 3-phosphatidyltransferase [Myriangium duriaei CBS 260.36]|uniref:CDP-diacylglycerol--inositol 3-phosphatidyltransferase n=1 Tax=Myriangium duriaei CBS 260.36 TaxID=1168546 RepID=A0A9P4MJF7_9PEZI|nr:CDP-diacylglycerol--inositol 3-phosphatidyltransferase [Myriangium duriaei CBS 260.36]